MTLELQYFRRGWFTVPAVQVTVDNWRAVFEWADSKPFFDPVPSQGEPMTVTGLTVFEPTGRHKANWGDWIYQTPSGDFRTRPDAEFRELFTAVQVPQ